MRYQSAVINIERPLREFTVALNEMQEDCVPEFVTEVINAVLEYGASEDTAVGSIDEYVRETVAMYKNSVPDTYEFEQALSRFCMAIFNALRRTGCYTDDGCLMATVTRFFGDDVALRRLTEDELNAYLPPP